MKSSKKTATKASDFAVVKRRASREKGRAKGIAESAEGAQEKAGTVGEWRPGTVDLAKLATLLAINDSIQHPGGEGKRGPRDFLSAACELLNEAERFWPYRLVVEYMNKQGRRPVSLHDSCGREYAWKEALAVQTEAPKGRSSLCRLVVGASVKEHGTQIRSDREFGPVFFHDHDLVNRPVGISAVGSIGSKKGLRNAIKRVFAPDDAARIIARKTLTLWEINQILQNQIKIYGGRIPKVRAKGYTTA
jgi:hypothetical protein